MSSSVKDRIKAFLEYLNISQGKFEGITGLSNGAINNIGEGISTRTLNKITAKYPQLNTAWVLTGVGEMLINENGQPTTTKKVVHEKASALSKEITDKAFNNVTRKELAKLMAKVYGKPLQVILDELEESELLEASLLVKGV